MAADAASRSGSSEQHDGITKQVDVGFQVSFLILCQLGFCGIQRQPSHV
jgi:hypothetical protein